MKHARETNPRPLHKQPESRESRLLRGAGEPSKLLPWDGLSRFGFPRDPPALFWALLFMLEYFPRQGKNLGPSAAEFHAQSASILDTGWLGQMQLGRNLRPSFFQSAASCRGKQAQRQQTACRGAFSSPYHSPIRLRPPAGFVYPSSVDDALRSRPGPAGGLLFVYLLSFIFSFFPLVFSTSSFRLRVAVQDALRDP